MRDQDALREMVSWADAGRVARALLGCVLVRTMEDGARLSGRIVEAEAYLGVEDRASHSYGGRRTPRTEPMYAAGGAAYVYFTYGMHHCMNVVCGPRDQPSAVLVRSLEPVEGVERMRAHRPKARGESDLCSGPGKVCEALRIDRSLSGVDLLSAGALRLEPGGLREVERVRMGPRIGIGDAGAWAGRLLRFWVEGSKFVGVERNAGRRMRQGDER